MSLKESWLADRQSRQHETTDRQQAVQSLLSEFNQTRQAIAAQVQQQRTEFRAALSQSEDQRRADFQLFQTALQQYCQHLQQETTELLATATADRSLMAAQLATELQQFHAELATSVRSLRATNQTNLATLQAETQAFLADCQSQRVQLSTELFQNLQHSRSQRNAEMQTLFTHLGEFRASLRQFRLSLSDTVWGQTAPTEPKAVPVRTMPKVTAIPPTHAIAAPAILPKTAASQTEPKPTPPGRPLPPKGTPKASAKPVAAKKVSTSKVSVPQTTPQLLPASPEPALQPVVLDEVPFEPEIYNLLQKQHGARLTQIESMLKVNRFQAVDALRSLIKKGLVTQRDRVYLAQVP